MIFFGFGQNVVELGSILCLSKYSPCTQNTPGVFSLKFRFFTRILRARLNTVGLFSDNDKTLLGYSRNSHKE
jgi:hypothetical protein